MAPKAIETCRQFLIYNKVYFTNVHLLVYFIDVNKKTKYVLFHLLIFSDPSKDNEMGPSCYMHRREEKRVAHFIRKN